MIYKDWMMIITSFILIFLGPIIPIYTYINEIYVDHYPPFIILCCVFSVVMFFYHRYLRGGIIIDINARIISYPKSFFKPNPRTVVSFDEITGIKDINEVRLEKDGMGGYQRDMAGYLKVVKTYKLVIVGTFGSKTLSFRNEEKRDQFYSLLVTYGNFP